VVLSSLPAPQSGTRALCLTLGRDLDRFAALFAFPMSLRHHSNAAGRGFVVHRDGEALPASLRGAIVAIGNFDGLHRGHRHLIERTMAFAAAAGRPAAVLTFEPHPRQFFSPDRPMFRLTPEPVKLAILPKLGLDGVFVRRFDGRLAATSAAGFVDLVHHELAVAGVLVGHDFHFGRGREGTPATLADLASRHGLACEIVPAVEEAGEPVSSSAIRAALEAGEVERANRLLGYRWFVAGEVRHGGKRGRVLGFPTANLALRDCALRHGIYAVRAAFDGAVRDGVASFGRRPTFDDGAPLLEVHLFDFAGDLYGRRLEVEFAAWIRAEERFASVDALVARMGEDARQARTHLARPADLPTYIG
jgi:riboflavin kinase / FMN adenylyltransferase